MSVAQAALDRGCVIYRHTYEDGRWRLTLGTTLDVVQPQILFSHLHFTSWYKGKITNWGSGDAGMVWKRADIDGHPEKGNYLIWRDKKYDRPAG